MPTLPPPASYAPARGAPCPPDATAGGPPPPTFLGGGLQPGFLPEPPVHFLLKGYARVKIIWHVEDLRLDKDGEDWRAWVWDTLLEHLNYQPPSTSWMAYLIEVKGWLPEGAFGLTTDILSLTDESDMETLFRTRYGSFEENKRSIALGLRDSPDWREHFEDLFTWVFDETIEEYLQEICKDNQGSL